MIKYPASELFEFLYRKIHGIYEEFAFRLYYGPVFHRFLNHKYPYYKNLPSKYKLKFLRLVRDHYEYFTFVPRENFRLTGGMKAIICSAASQLAMHLPPECFTFYQKILVYPDYYKSSLTQKVHKGEVNPGFRLIVFSWRGIQEGLNRPDDGLNLLLHEFAHALWLESKLMQQEYTVFDQGLVSRFEALAEREQKAIQETEEHFFRRYAFTGVEEFFAVAVENFFERPSRFRQEMPELFTTLTKMFGQNPLS